MKKPFILLSVLTGLCFSQDSAQTYRERADFTPCIIEGQAVLKSKPPAVPARLRITADQASCGSSIINRGLLLSDGNAVRNVIVRLENVKSGKPVRLETPPQISDERCDFYPKILAVNRGQEVIFRNGDKIYNDFRAVLDNQVLFNIALPMAGQTFARKMKKCGVADLYCNVHPWEHALILVASNPYFAVSDSSGRFRIEDVPPGRYTLTAVHEVLGKKSVTVDVIPDKKADVLLEF